MSVQVKGVGTIGGLDQGLNVVGVVTATQFNGAVSATTGTFTGDLTIPDKIIHSGDTNTAIRFPAADTITAETSGSERLRISSDGKIGIATDTGSGLINTRHAGTNQQVLHVRADLGSLNGRSLNLFTPDTDNSTAPFRFQTGNGFLFQCDAENVFTIAHDRKVGIGTNAPTAELNVAAFGASDEPTIKISGENSSIFLRTAGSSGSFPTGGGGNDGELVYIGGDFRFGIGDAGHDLIIFNGGGGSGYAERLRIKSTGYLIFNDADVNIHTSADTSRLRLWGGSANSVSNGATLTLQGVNHSSGNFADLAAGSGGHIQFRIAGTEHMRIQPNGEIAMRSSGTPSDALANLHVQNDTFRVSNDNDGADTTYIALTAHTSATDNDRNVIKHVNNSVIKSQISNVGHIFTHASHYVGRTRTDVDSPANVYNNGSHGFFAYSGTTNNTANLRGMAYIRAWDGGDTGDRNIIYYTDSGSDTTTNDYDQHQKFGVKANGAVHSGSNIFAGRIESDEGSPNSVYPSGNGTCFIAYPGVTAQQSQFRARTTNSNSEFTIYIDSGAGVNFKLSSAGRLYRDNTTEYSPADYAEMFEWKDGNTSSEIRTGMTVVLEDEMIRPATSSDDPSKIIGVVSANPVIIGDAAPLSYKDKHLKDAYGGDVFDDGTEMLIWNSFGTDFIDGKKVPRAQPDPTDCNCSPDFSVPVADIEKEKAKGNVPQAAIDQNIRMTVKNRLRNPNYDPNKTYVPRMDRKEWDAIGLLGKLIIRRGQPIGANWILMKSNVGVDPNDNSIVLDKYLVR